MNSEHTTNFPAPRTLLCAPRTLLRTVNFAAHCEPSCPTNVRARRELSRASRTFPRAANFLCAANVFCTPRTFPRTFATRREPSCAPRTFPCAARVAPRACPRLGELRTRHELPTRLAHFCTRRELFYAVNFAAHCEPSAPRTFVYRELAAFACAPRTLPTWRGISAANVPVWSELRLRVANVYARRALSRASRCGTGYEPGSYTERADLLTAIRTRLGLDQRPALAEYSIPTSRSTST